MRRETRGREGGIRQEGRKVGGELERGKQWSGGNLKKREAGRQADKQTNR